MSRFTDCSGNRYEIVLSDDEIAPILSLFFEGDGQIQKRQIGYANLFNLGEALGLQDIRIFERVILIRRFEWLAVFGYRRREEKNFQRLGLGTALLKSVFELAKAKGFKMVSGQIVRRDLEKNPNLPKWYSKQGFTVTETANGFDIVAQVSPD